MDGVLARCVLARPGQRYLGIFSFVSDLAWVEPQWQASGWCGCCMKCRLLHGYLGTLPVLAG